MPVPIWEERFQLGVDQIDRQHYHLFTATRELYHALMDGSLQELTTVKRQSLEYLNEYVCSHFQDEERFMQEIGYPGLPEHRKLHEDFASTVRRHHDESEIESLALTSSLMITMLNWFSEHFLVEDMKYIVFHRNGESSTSLEEAWEERSRESSS